MKEHTPNVVNVNHSGGFPSHVTKMRYLDEWDRRPQSEFWRKHVWRTLPLVGTGCSYLDAAVPLDGDEWEDKDRDLAGHHGDEATKGTVPRGHPLMSMLVVFVTERYVQGAHSDQVNAHQEVSHYAQDKNTIAATMKGKTHFSTIQSTFLGR